MALVSGAVFLPLKEWTLQAIHFYSSLGVIGIALFFLTFTLASLALIFPTTVLTFAAGALYGLWGGYLVITASALLAVVIGFFLGRGLMRKSAEQWLQNHSRFRAMDKAIAKRDIFATTFLRLSPVVPFSLSNYLFGLTPVRFWRYLLASWIGMTPITLLYVYIGTLGRRALDPDMEFGLVRLMVLAAGIALTGLLTVVMTRTARKEFRLDQADNGNVAPQPSNATKGC